MFLTRFSYFSCYFLILVFFHNCYLLIYHALSRLNGNHFLVPFLIPLALRGSTSYMRPQNLGTARVVSRSKTISAFLAKGFWWKCPFGECESYLSYSQKLSDRHFLAWHKPRWATQYSPGMESPRSFQLMNKVDCYVPRALCNSIVRTFLATKTFAAGSSTYPCHIACVSKSVPRDFISSSDY